VAGGSYGAPGGPPPADWQTPGPAADKPIIRPAVSSPMAPAPGRRAAGGPVASFEELGIEDSELDSPTFMRRRTTDGMAAAGYRVPGDK
jgi:hypothetical protein